LIDTALSYGEGALAQVVIGAFCCVSFMWHCATASYSRNFSVAHPHACIIEVLANEEVLILGSARENAARQARGNVYCRIKKGASQP
jgi:hypothetical protein